MAAADLDADGHAELIVRSKGGQVTIYWGGVEGIDADRMTVAHQGSSEPVESQ